MQRGPLRVLVNARTVHNFSPRAHWPFRINCTSNPRRSFRAQNRRWRKAAMIVANTLVSCVPKSSIKTSPCGASRSVSPVPPQLRAHLRRRTAGPSRYQYHRETHPIEHSELCSPCRSSAREHLGGALAICVSSDCAASLCVTGVSVPRSASRHAWFAYQPQRLFALHLFFVCLVDLVVSM